MQISETTEKAIAKLFELEALGPIEVKGKAEPVETYRVIRPKAKPGRLRGIEGLDSPLVGRDRDLAALRGRVDALRRGAGQVTSIMAEAGLGKSRLAAELRKQLQREGVMDELCWLEGRSLSYQTSTPYARLRAEGRRRRKATRHALSHFQRVRQPGNGLSARQPTATSQDGRGS